MALADIILIIQLRDLLRHLMLLEFIARVVHLSELPAILHVFFEVLVAVR